MLFLVVQVKEEPIDNGYDDSVENLEPYDLDDQPDINDRAKKKTSKRKSKKADDLDEDYHPKKKKTTKKVKKKVTNKKQKLGEKFEIKNEPGEWSETPPEKYAKWNAEKAKLLIGHKSDGTGTKH